MDPISVGIFLAGLIAGSHAASQFSESDDSSTSSCPNCGAKGEDHSYNSGDSFRNDNEGYTCAKR